MYFFIFSPCFVFLFLSRCSRLPMNGQGITGMSKPHIRCSLKEENALASLKPTILSAHLPRCANFFYAEQFRPMSAVG